MAEKKLDTLFYEYELRTKGLEEDVARVKEQLQAVASTSEATSQSVNFVKKAFEGLSLAAVGYKAVEYAKQALELADAYSGLHSKLVLVTTGAEDLAHVQGQLFNISQDTRSDLESNVALYATLARTTKTLGLSQGELLSITKTIAQTFLISGAGAQEAAGAIHQFSQALSVGVLRGQDLNSVLEGAPRLGQVIADSLGVTTGALRQMGEEGKISAAAITNALLKASQSVDAEAAKIAPTFAGSVVQVKNAMLVLVGEFDRGARTSRGFADVIGELAKHLASAAGEANKLGREVGILFAAFQEQSNQDDLIGGQITGFTHALQGLTNGSLADYRKGVKENQDATDRYRESVQKVKDLLNSLGQTPPTLPKTVLEDSGFDASGIKNFNKPKVVDSKEYLEAAAAAKLAIEQQTALNTVFGATAEVIRDVNAAFAHRGALAKIDATTFTPAEILALKNFENHLYALKKAENELADARKKNAEDLVKFYSDIEQARINAQPKNRVNVAGSGLDVGDGQQLAPIGEFQQKFSEKNDKIFKDFKEKIGPELIKLGEPFKHLTGAADEWADHLQTVLGVAQSIAAVLASGGGAFGDRIKEAAGVVSGVGQIALSKGDPIKIASGIGGIIDSLDLFGTHAREVTRAIQTEQDRLNASYQTQLLAIKSIIANTAPLLTSINEVHSQFTDLRAQLVQLATIQEGPLKGQLIAGKQYNAALADLNKTEAARIQQLQDEHDDMVRAADDDLNVQALVAEGRNAEADAMRTQLSLQKEIDEASKDTTVTGQKYLAHLKEVRAEQQAAADALARDPLNEFANRVKLFGITGKEYLDGFVTAAKAKFSEFGGLLDGLDLSTQSGLDEFREHLHALYNQFLANDGVIDEHEQAILDAGATVFTTANDLFDKIDARIQRSLAQADSDNQVLGGDARAQAGRTIGAAKGFDPILDGILASGDLASASSAQALQKRLQDYYLDLIKDGITDTESPIVALIKQLLAGVNGAIDEGVADSNKKLSDALNERTQNRSKASRDVALGDLTGLDAFEATIHGLTPELAAFFDQFDANTTTGIASAKDGVRALAKEIDGLTDEQTLAEFGVTKDELNTILLDVDNGLDGLNDTLKTTAQNAIDAANKLADFDESVDNDYLRATGHDQDADVAESRARTAKRIQDAKDLNASQDYIDKIIAIGAKDIETINQGYADALAQANAPLANTIAPSSSSSSFTASSVTAITQTQALSLVDINNSQLVVQQRIYALMQSLVGATPELRVPAVPSGSGGFTSAGAGATNAFYINITLQSTGVSTASDAQQLAGQLLQYIDEGLSRSAGIESRRTGATF